jgi:hypothetical protein
LLSFSVGSRGWDKIGAEELQDEAKSLATSGESNPLVDRAQRIGLGVPSKLFDLRLSEFVRWILGDGRGDRRVVRLRWGLFWGDDRRGVVGENPMESNDTLKSRSRSGSWRRSKDWETLNGSSKNDPDVVLSWFKEGKKEGAALRSGEAVVEVAEVDAE